MNNELNITIRIANQPPISLAIKREDEELLRTAEFNVNHLWAKWCKDYTSKSPSEVLAMVAFRFAELFYTQSAMLKKSETVLKDFEGDLDKILQGMMDPHSGENNEK